MSASPLRNPGVFDLGRLTALIDGVFAVALTLLVLDLKLPSESRDLARGLAQMVPGFLVYLIAFASVAGYWTIHHGTFRHVLHGDGRLVVLSLANLLFITLFPVGASIVGAHPLDPLAMACLSANSLLYCVSAWALWSYAAKEGRLTQGDADRVVLRHVARIMLLIGAGLAVAIPLAFLSVYLAYGLWMVWPPISASWVSRRWSPRA